MVMLQELRVHLSRMKIGTSTASFLNPTPILFLITLLAVFLWPDSVGLTATVVMAAVIVPLALAWFSNSPEAAILMVITASAMPRIFLEIGGLKARPEHLISGLMICALPFLWKKRPEPVQWILPDYLLMAYIALNFFSSLFGSPEPPQTEKWAVQQVLAILPYFWLRVYISDQARMHKAFRFLLLIGVIVSGYAVLCFYANAFFATEFGVDVAQYGDIPATYGVQYEANILGAYSGALAVMLLAMYLQERSRKFLIGCAFFAMMAMTVSLSRAALGATFAGFLLVAVFAYRRKLLNARVVFSAATAFLCAALLILPFVLGHYTNRFSTFEISDPTADPNTFTRTVQIVSAADEIAKHPVFGSGTASFQLAFDWKDFGAGWEDVGWIGNTELRVLHDMGVVGLLVFLLFIGSLARRGWKIIKLENNPELVALLAASVVYLISFQFTEGTLLAFTWVHLGMIGCAISLTRKDAGTESGQLQRAVRKS